MRDEIPVKYIKEQVERCYYIAARSTDATAPYWGHAAQALKTLLQEWELFGDKWERENGINQ